MGKYVPSNVPPTAEAVPGFLRTELNVIAKSWATPEDMLVLQTLYAAPSRLLEGAIALADGTSWNPGSGAGVYAYYAGSWKKLG